MFAEEFWDEVIDSDVMLVNGRVSWDLDDFHSIPEGGFNGIEGIGSSDEEDLTEIDGEFDVIVAEGGVLLWIEDFEEGAGGVTVDIGSEFIDFIEHDDWVHRFDATESLNDSSGHTSDVSASVSADFAFIVDAAEAESMEFAIECARDAFAEACFADAGGAV